MTTKAPASLPTNLSLQSAVANNTEKRFTYRKRMQSPATLWDSELKTNVRCKIVDMSSTGAKLTLDPNDPAYGRLVRFMPRQFWIKMLYDGAQVCCEVQWQDENRFGVRFISNFEIA